MKLKRLAALVLTVCIGISLAACGSKEEESNAETKADVRGETKAPEEDPEKKLPKRFPQ